MSTDRDGSGGRTGSARPPRISVEVVVDGEPWREVSDLGESGPEDHHFVLRAGEDGATLVEFGDGRHGRRPAPGSSTAVTYGRGSGRSSSVLVQPGRLTLHGDWPGVAPGGVTRTVLADLVEAFNAHDLDRIMGFFADDCVLEMPRGPDPWGARFEGRAAVREGLGQRLAGLPDVHYGDDEHWLCGTHAVSTWLLTGTRPDGARVVVRGCDLFDLAPDGRIERKDSYWKIVD